MMRIAIIGGGSWGTALSIVLARSGHAIRLWVYEPELVEAISLQRRNPLYLPDFPIPAEVQAFQDLGLCLEGAEVVLSVLPSHHCRRLYTEMLPYLRPGLTFVSATKGIENDRLQCVSSIIQEVLPDRLAARVAVISGPSFAQEVARGDPTAVVVASRDESTARLVQQEFSSSTLRLYTSSDVVGVELGGAIKNVIAIAAGVCAGLGFGSNTTAALITRGLAEMTRLALSCGGKKETLAGLAGMGDLVLTCTGQLSRNRTVGVKLGQGQKLAEIVQATRMVAEGVLTTRATLELARKRHVEMPITEQMGLVLHHDKDPRLAIRDLMERRLKEE